MLLMKSLLNSYACKCQVITNLFWNRLGFKGDLERVKLLNECEADLSVHDYDYRTLAHLAAAENHFDLLYYLISNSNFDFNVQDRWGHTPLDEIKDKRIRS